MRTRRTLDKLPEGLSQELMEHRAGTFVSLRIDGRLRGCIGIIAPTRENVAWEIVQNAVSAGTRDPRFPEVQTQELDDLEYSVDTLGEPEPVDSAAQLDPQTIRGYCELRPAAGAAAARSGGSGYGRAAAGYRPAQGWDQPSGALPDPALPGGTSLRRRSGSCPGGAPRSVLTSPSKDLSL